MTKKNRIPISKELAAKVLFLSDRTCCKCNIPGRYVQIHHIDENPSNNEESNLAVLCSICHDETMIKGGFGRQLDSNQVILYRNSWLERVQSRKEKADELASITTVTGIEQKNQQIESLEDFLDYKINYDRDTLQKYLNQIVNIHKAQWVISQAKYDSGVTSNMVQGSYDLIDFYEEILVEIATFYPKGHFNNLHPKIFFNNLIAEKFLWHRLILESGGIGTGGTAISVIAAENVAEDLSNLVVEFVNTLTWTYHGIAGIEIDKWTESWKG